MFVAPRLPLDQACEIRGTIMAETKVTLPEAHGQLDANAMGGDGYQPSRICRALANTTRTKFGGARDWLPCTGL